MAKVADAGENQFLEREERALNIANVVGCRLRVGAQTNLGFRDIFRCLDPFDFVAKLLNGIHQAADVAGNIVEEVDGGHFGPMCCRPGLRWRIVV